MKKRRYSIVFFAILLFICIPAMAYADSATSTASSTGLKLSNQLISAMKKPPIIEVPEVTEKEGNGGVLPGGISLRPDLLANLGISVPAGGSQGQTDRDHVTRIEGFQLTEDRLYIKTSGHVSFNTFSLDQPKRLVIDIQTSQLDPSLYDSHGDPVGEMVVTHPLVEKIRYSNFSSHPSTVRIVLDLKVKTKAVVQPMPIANQYTLQLSEVKHRVVVDAGHGGHDSGAVSITGRYEKDFNLSMVKKVKELLEHDANIELYFTRLTDHFVALNDRVAFAEQVEADLFVSIHGNSFSAERSGTETYYYNAYSLPFAQLVHSHVLASTGFRDGQVRKERFRVITGTSMPAVLLEIGYLSNAKEESQLYDEKFQYRVAQAIVKAIKEYFGR